MRTLSRRLVICSILLTLVSSPGPVSAYNGAFFIAAENEVFGDNDEYTIRNEDETLIDQAMDHNLGYNEIIDANKSTDPWNPGIGKRVVIPTSWILPSFSPSQVNAATGFILVNLAEFRLYLVKKAGPLYSVITFPVGIGRTGFETPAGKYHVVEKLKDPTWIIPGSFRDELPDLPDVVPPGPENPLGRFVLKLSGPGLLIHESTDPLSIGRRVSHGCVRMTPEDMKDLYDMVHSGFEVIILYQPVKIGVRGGTIHVEIHKDYLKQADPLKEAVKELTKLDLMHRIDAAKLNQATAERTGVPVPIGSERKVPAVEADR